MILGCRNDVLHNIRFGPNKYVKENDFLNRMKYIYLIRFKYIEYFLSVENKKACELLINK